MYNVAVLMSTYNGEKYLSEQIDSILSQKDVNIHLYIRDDGSYDNTINIILDCKKKYDNITLYKENNIGVGNSFMELLYKVPDTYDYYAFSDQDDIWLDNKVINAIKLLNISNKKLYASNQTLIDKYCNIIKNRYKHDIKLHFKPIEILFSNDLPGCTMVFDNDFYHILINKEHRPNKEILEIRIHDVWVAIVASLFDEIIYDNNSYIFYRQHEDNVVGAYKDNIFKKFYIKFNKLVNIKNRNPRSRLAKELLLRFNSLVKQDVLLYASAKSDVFIYKKVLFKNIKYLSSINNEHLISLLLKLIFNYY